MFKNKKMQHATTLIIVFINYLITKKSTEQIFNIKNADKIIERYTHKELAEQKGYYYDLARI